MLAQLEISKSDWTVFIAAILFFLALDLGVFHRKAHVVKFKEAALWSVIWFILALCFGFFLAREMVPNWGAIERDEFITGYIIELSLSMDNVFVIALIFQYFRVPLQYQHRVLFWGILGALIMRVWLMQRFRAETTRVNRQQSERLRFLVAAYRSLAGSFTPATAEWGTP